MNARFIGRATSLLAANQRIEEDVYLVDFPFNGRMATAQATFTDADGILIGTGMLREYRLHVDFRLGTVSLDNA